MLLHELIKLQITKWDTTGKRSRAAAEPGDTQETVERPECGGRVSGSENPFSGEEPRLHPHH